MPVDDVANITAVLSKDDAAAISTATTNPIKPAGYADGFSVMPLAQSETNALKLSIQPVSSTEGVGVMGWPPTVFTRLPYVQNDVSNTDVISDLTIISPQVTASFDVADGTKFSLGDILAIGSELMFVIGKSVNTLTVFRQWGGTPNHSLVDGDVIYIIKTSDASGFDPDTDEIYPGIIYKEFLKRIGATAAGGSTGATTNPTPDTIQHKGMDGTVEVVSVNDIAGNRNVTYP